MQVSSCGLHSLLKRLPGATPATKVSDFLENDKEDMWRKYFRVQKLETANWYGIAQHGSLAAGALA